MPRDENSGRDAMNQNTAIYARMIEAAAQGDMKAERFLRQRLKTTAEGMPLSLLITLSEAILEFRRSELTDDANRN
jgi:hypothetical protein